MSGAVGTDHRDLHWMSCKDESGLCSTSDADGAESVCSMDMSTTDDSCSDISLDDADSEDDTGFLEDSRLTPEQTLLIFDWDDTILPSTWVQKQGLRLDDASVVTEEQRVQLAAMAECAIRTLQAAKRYGTIVLVTNAERGWIELSSRKFMPALCPLLESFKIISARAAHEKPGVTLPSMWKTLAFRTEVDSFYKTLNPESTKNVISFGDAMHERLAVFNVTRDMPNCLTKSLKFMVQPQLEQLQKEHELIFWCLRHIVSHDGTLDLEVKIA